MPSAGLNHEVLIHPAPSQLLEVADADHPTKRRKVNDSSRGSTRAPRGKAGNRRRSGAQALASTSAAGSLSYKTSNSTLPQTSSGHPGDPGSNGHHRVIGFQMVSAESIVQSGYRDPSADTVGAVPNLHTMMPLPNSRLQSSPSYNTINNYGVPFTAQYYPTPTAGPTQAYYNTNYYHTPLSGSEMYPSNPHPSFRGFVQYNGS